MTFQQEKQQTLEKMQTCDKSRAGKIDGPIAKLCSLINASDDYYTTSSCSGRILLTVDGEKRHDMHWLFISHEKTQFEDIKSALKNQDNVWFRYQPFILHIACKNLESATSLVKKSKSIGLKRSGIIESDKRFVVEIISNERLETPLSLVSDDYLKLLTTIANEKLESTHEKIRLLEKEFTNP